MKKIILTISLIAAICLSGAFHNFSAAKTTASRQTAVHPFCKFTFIDHRGHSVKLATNIIHASNTTLTFIFETGEKLTMKFAAIRAGHFVAESARSRDPQIIFYPAHSGNIYGMVGAVMITSTKPISGNFSHLASDDDNEHLTLVSGSFSF